MKNASLIVIVIVSLTGVPAAAQSPVAADGAARARPNNLSLNLLGFLLAPQTISYTRGLGRFVSVGPFFAYGAPLILKAHLVGGGLDVLFWPRRANSGFFVGPSITIAKAYATEADTGGSVLLAVGALAGWRWLLRNGINFGLGLGPGYGVDLSQDQRCTTSGATTSCKWVSFAGFKLRLLADVGWAF